jgi:broad specificity phosphatase PhoE
MRHFPVKEPLPVGWHTAAELHQWRQRYDASAVIARSLCPCAIEWRQCYSSDLSRALATARAAYADPIVETSLLREIETAPFRTGALRLPIWLWRWMLHVAWRTSHASQRALRDDFLQRVRAVSDLLAAAQEDTLVVSHAGTMMYLRRELLLRGFRGPKFGIAEHAKVYVFERGK